MSAYRPGPLNWTPALDAAIMDGLSEEQSFTQIARALGVSPAQVSSRFKRLRDIMGGQAK